MLHELTDEATGLDTLPLDELAELELPDELAVRSALIRLEQIGRDVDDVKRRRQAVVGAYDAQINALEAQAGWLRRSLQEYVERNGKTSFPDVGTAYTRRGDPAIEIVDKEAFKTELGAMFVKEQFDETGAKRYALEQMLDHGVLLPGCRLRPGGPTLAIRKAGA